MLSMKQAASRPEAAVAKGGVGLDAAKLHQIDAEVMERFGHRFGDAEIGHRVEQQAADQKLQGKIIDSLATVGIGPGGGVQPALDNDVAGSKSDGEKPVARARDLRNLSDRIGQLGQHCGL